MNVITPRGLAALASLALAFVSSGCPDATEVATECVQRDIIAACPAGSNPIIGASAESACGGSFDGNVVTEGVSASGQCNSSGACEVLCQFEVPCTCGVATLTKEQIVCAECPEQSCGDSRCEGTERATCEASGSGCQPCPEDCGGASCGDGDCTGAESPATCPQDCARECEPNAQECIGNVVRKCSADGASAVTIDCAASGLVCNPATTNCVPAGACGNDVCEAGEGASCPEDCAGLCEPGAKRCEGPTLVTCAADGQSETRFDCGAEVCAAGACRPRDVCGNLVCEGDEATTCTGDCTTCGNGTCEADEQTTCPQDCGVCTPSSRECLGDILRVCTANGVRFDDIDCGTFEQICARGACATPGLCGNGACEDGEDDTTCAGDCRELCGNGTCGGSEDFASCSSDCPPRCGDGSCNGDERAATCALDCLATCGNGACDGVEDRANCPGDCGFCGNGECEDGAESPELVPPGTLESCLADCVTSACGEDADCDDAQACTTNTCIDGACGYQPNDAACPANQKCIKFNGCCPDADRDGYADAACGGSDCDDGDGDVHPGALEACGGGDKNCNGTHAPTLTPARRVTNTPSLKADLAMAHGAGGYVAAWTGTPEATTKVEYARLDATGALSGAVRTVPSAKAVVKPQLAYSASENRFGLAWQEPDGIAGKMNFVLPDGALERDDTIALEQYCPMARTMTWVADRYVIPTNYNCGVEPWRVVSEAGGVTEATLYTVELKNAVAGGGRVNALYANELFKLDPTDLSNYVHVYITGDHTTGQADARLAWDGELLAWTTRGPDGVFYERLFDNGFVESSWPVTTQAVDPVDVAYAPERPGVGARVGVLMTEGTSNLYLFVRNQDGSEALPLGLVAGGNDVRDAHLFWDGEHFVVFWLAKVNQIHQLHTTTVSCE